MIFRVSGLNLARCLVFAGAGLVSSWLLAMVLVGLGLYALMYLILVVLCLFVVIFSRYIEQPKRNWFIAFVLLFVLRALAGIVLAHHVTSNLHRLQQVNSSVFVAFPEVSIVDSAIQATVRSLERLTQEEAERHLDPFTGNLLEQSSAGYYYSIGPDFMDQKGDVAYDPTNGTISVGDVIVGSFYSNFRMENIDRRFHGPSAE